MERVKLGLIGGNIRASSSPRLHREAGRLAGLDVRYELLIPAELGTGFDALFDACRDGGYRGLNITYPYKETVLQRVTPATPRIAQLGAVNTVLFGADGPVGHNTDYSGFVAAFRHRFGATSPGVVAMAGAGGVGKACGFGLVELGVRALRIVDHDRQKADGLAAALRTLQPGLDVRVVATAAEAADGADGLINCTPLGMVGTPGMPFPEAGIHAGQWVFDAVYTPLETGLLRAAERAGAAVMSGYELFLFQGMQAFELFTGHAVDENELRQRLR